MNNKENLEININKYLGSSFISKYNQTYTIIEYINTKNVTVKFEDGTVVTGKELGQVKIGSIKNPNLPNIYNLGFLGQGVYIASVRGKQTGEYMTWVSMFTRCYDSKYQIKQPTYIGCTVHPEWHNFQNFAKWYEENYIENFHLDKDILVPGNKIYGPDTCCFVPQVINNLFIKRNNKSELEIKLFADKFRDKITPECYNAMYNYKV